MQDPPEKKAGPDTDRRLPDAGLPAAFRTAGKDPPALFYAGFERSAVEISAGFCYNSREIKQRVKIGASGLPETPAVNEVRNFLDNYQ